METYVLGAEVEFRGRLWLTVRIVTSTSVFENGDGTLSLVEERYVQLRNESGNIEFVILHENETSCERKSTIKALPNFPWRKNVKNNV